MTPEAFRRLAMSLDGAIEGAHQGHADFHGRGQIFATFGYPAEGSAALMLPPEEQVLIVDLAAGAASPVKGAWGEKGATRLDLAALDDATAESGLRMAWRRPVKTKTGHERKGAR